MDQNYKNEIKIGIAGNEEAKAIIDGFKIKKMMLKDAKSGKIFWECLDWDMKLSERTEKFPAEILKCKRVSRVVEFSSIKKINNFSIKQRVWLFGKKVEELNFKFGFVIPNSTNSWDQTIIAAPPDKMIPINVINGNAIMETIFYDQENIIYRGTIKIIYE